MAVFLETVFVFEIYIQNMENLEFDLYKVHLNIKNKHVLHLKSGTPLLWQRESIYVKADNLDEASNISKDFCDFYTDDSYQFEIESVEKPMHYTAENSIKDYVLKDRFGHVRKENETDEIFISRLRKQSQERVCKFTELIQKYTGVVNTFYRKKQFNKNCKYINVADYGQMTLDGVEQTLKNYKKYLKTAHRDLEIVNKIRNDKFSKKDITNYKHYIALLNENNIFRNNNFNTKLFNYPIPGL